MQRGLESEVKGVRSTEERLEHVVQVCGQTPRCFLNGAMHKFRFSFTTLHGAASIMEDKASQCTEIEAKPLIELLPCSPSYQTSSRMN